jgi:hypothetical protein
MQLPIIAFASLSPSLGSSLSGFYIISSDFNRLNSSVPGVFKFSTAVRSSKYSLHCFSVIVVSNGARRPHLSIHFLALGVVGALILNLGPPHCGFVDFFRLGSGEVFAFFDFEESSLFADDSRDLLELEGTDTSSAPRKDSRKESMVGGILRLELVVGLGSAMA